MLLLYKHQRAGRETSVNRKSITPEKKVAPKTLIVFGDADISAQRGIDNVRQSEIGDGALLDAVRYALLSSFIASLPLTLAYLQDDREPLAILP